MDSMLHRPGQPIRIKSRPMMMLVLSFILTLGILGWIWFAGPEPGDTVSLRQSLEDELENLGDEESFEDLKPRHVPDYKHHAVIPAQHVVAKPKPTPPSILHPSHIFTKPEAQSLKTDKEKEDFSFKMFAFNEYKSSLIPYNRQIVDSRPGTCRNINYPAPSSLPKASVIICFVNEAWSALFRTVWTVIERSPPEVLLEIILYDDGSDAPWTQSELEDELTTLPSYVKLVRSPKRLGLIRARMEGAKVAQGQILVFLDSHCEANVGWLEPIVAFIADDKTRVVCPTIDSINAHSMTYQNSPGQSRGTFHWTLDFTWEYSPHIDTSTGYQAIKSPTMAGGLFAIDRDYFYEIGTYDSGMGGWGGENLEMSFRIWMCGGSLHILPCSRVGHIFRDSHPYKIPNSTVNDSFLHNSIRLAEVWMDEYKEIFYSIRPSSKEVDFGDVSERKRFRKSHKCKSFQWYMDNIVPGKYVPNENNILYKGQLKNAKNQCVDKGAGHLLYPCHPTHIKSTSQAFWFTKQGEIRYVWDTCLNNYGSQLRLSSCGPSAQGWEYDPQTQSIKYNGKCLHGSESKLRLETCNNSPAQQFHFTGIINA